MPTHAGTALLVAGSDLVGLVAERSGAALVARLGVVPVPIPFPLPPIEISMAWHPRHDADPAQGWFRGRMRVAPGSGPGAGVGKGGGVGAGPVGGHA